MHDRCHNRRASGDEFACTGGWPVVGPVFRLDDNGERGTVAFVSQVGRHDSRRPLAPDRADRSRSSMM